MSTVVRSTFICPNCGRQGKSGSPIPDGTRLRCPGCKQSFAATASPEPNLEDLEGLDEGDPVQETSDLDSVLPGSGPDAGDASLGEIRDLLSDLVGLFRSGSAPQAPKPGKRRYKVLTQKDKWFSAKFDPELLEKAVNAYADQGWMVRGITTASIPGFSGNREELIVLLERDDV